MPPQPELPRVAHLHCLYCGGERRGDDSACLKCHAPAPSVPCQRCRAEVFAPRDLCICGERCYAWNVAAPEGVSCPRCQGKLARVAVDHGSVHVEQCARCLGCFARTFEFSVLLEHEVARESERPASFMAAGAFELPRQALLAEVSCPYCSAPMERVRFDQKAGIVIDVCPRHGLWLDAGELPQVLDHIRDVAAGKAAPDEADLADTQHWDHVLAEKAFQEREIAKAIPRFDDREMGRRNTARVVEAVLHGRWAGLLALEGRRGE